MAGVIGGVLGAMLTLKIFGDQEREQAEEDRDRGTPDMGREPVEDDYIPELWILFKMGEFPFLFFFCYFFYF